MLSLLKNKVRPIGLDIGRTSVKMIQLAVQGGRISVIAADQMAVSTVGDAAQQRTAIVSAIKEMRERSGFRGNTIVSCLSNEQLKIKNLRIDASEQENIEAVLTKDVAERFGLNAEKDQIEYMIAGTVRQGDELKSELLVFAVDKESVKSHIEMLEEAGLEPVSIDTVPCALFRSFEGTTRRQDDKDIVNVCVDLGSHFTTVVVGRGSDISFVKQIPLGGENFNADISAKLGVDIEQAAALRRRLNDEGDAAGIEAVTRQAVMDAMQETIEQLAKEISLCFRYYSVTFRGSRPGRAIFTGGEANEATLLAALRRQLAVDIEIARPLQGFDLSNVNFNDERRGGPMCEWAIAVGLSLKGLRNDQGRMMHERN
ncbi:MAG: pilus assembly protein PilM [Sedimentisphaerales bacterium]|nr:pilus assembly protein PilM [Sedimentisphaerales bacterium]